MRRRVGEVVTRHPAWSVFAVALVARVCFAIVSFAANHVVLIPDELQYILLARAVAAGRGAASWSPAFGQQLLRETWAFSGPMTLLYRVLPASRLVGQLYAAGIGAALAPLTYVAARRVTRPATAIGAGFLVALCPSQILWSSVVLRESTVWLALCVIGAGIVLASSRQREIAGVALVVAGLFVLAGTREQTLLVASWAVIGVAVTFWRRRALCVAVVAAALLVPIVPGAGLGGIGLLRNTAPVLGSTRTALSFDADSAFAPTTIVGRTGAQRPSLVHSSDPSAQFPRASGNGDTRLVTSKDGTVSLADEGLAANLRAAPRGLVATMFRPGVWESTSSLGEGLARFENLLWYVLYVLAGIGLWARRRRGAVVWYPALVVLGYLATASVTQGNVGTAFRHRSQVLWALAVLAAAGVDVLVARRMRPMSATGAARRSAARDRSDAAPASVG